MLRGVEPGGQVLPDQRRRQYVGCGRALRGDRSNPGRFIVSTLVAGAPSSLRGRPCSGVHPVGQGCQLVVEESGVDVQGRGSFRERRPGSPPGTCEGLPV
jgi:hypothetical protein